MAIVLIIVLVGLSGFGLGRLSVDDNSGSPIEITRSASVVQSNAQATDGSFVGSKNGSVYHFPWCSGAQRIKEENKVWFTSKADAESKGYRPAANCKGL